MDVRRRKSKTLDNNKQTERQSAKFDCDNATPETSNKKSQDQVRNNVNKFFNIVYYIYITEFYLYSNFFPQPNVAERFIPQENDEELSKMRIVENAKESLDSSGIAQQKRITINMEFDVVAMILFVTGLATRLYRLEEPRSIV